MIQIIQKISVEVSKPNFFQAIVAKQYDSNSRFLKATLIQDNEKINVANTSTVTINAKRNDGAEKSFTGEVNDDGTVTVPLTYWMLELNGRLDCDISIFGADSSKLTSTTFTVEVERASCGSDDISDADENDIIIVQAKDVVTKDELAAAVNPFKRRLTGDDDLNNIVEPGVYYYYTTDTATTNPRPANAPFENAAIIEVVAANGTEARVIQRATRYGEAGISAFRALYGSAWGEWKQIPTITKKVISCTTNANGNADLQCKLSSQVVIAAYGTSTDGGTTYRCCQYASPSYDKWFGHFTGNSNESPAASVTMNATIYYITL